jgi:hypothetical protein
VQGEKVGKGVMENLTVLKIENLIGITIKWACPIYKHNLGHWGYGLDGGICKIDSFVDGNISSTIIEGSNISSAKMADYALLPHNIEWIRRDGGFMQVKGDGKNNCFYYSDEDRLVSFEIIN